MIISFPSFNFCTSRSFIEKGTGCELTWTISQFAQHYSYAKALNGTAKARPIPQGPPAPKADEAPVIDVSFYVVMNTKCCHPE